MRLFWSRTFTLPPVNSKVAWRGERYESAANCGIVSRPTTLRESMEMDSPSVPSGRMSTRVPVPAPPLGAGAGAAAGAAATFCIG
ncbi:MAG: hypothetical protein M5U28_35450 [Sandaracinaceae bacterium]|nr:hypothetical protein [Sandaracinaceae bacterium]